MLVNSVEVRSIVKRITNSDRMEHYGLSVGLLNSCIEVTDSEYNNRLFRGLRDEYSGLLNDYFGVGNWCEVKVDVKRIGSKYEFDCYVGI